MNRDDLEAARLVGEADLDVHLQAAGAHDGLVDHVLAVRHAWWWVGVWKRGLKWEEVEGSVGMAWPRAGQTHETDR